MPEEDYYIPGDDYVDWDLEDVMLFGTEEEKREFLKERAEAEYKRTHREKMNLTTGEDWDTGRHYIYLDKPTVERGVFFVDQIIIDMDDDEEALEERLRNYCWLLDVAGVEFTVHDEEYDYHKHCFKQECDE